MRDRGSPCRRRIAAIPLVAVLSLLSACAATESYRAPDGRFTLEHPAGWSVTTAEAAGVAHWRFTPEPLTDPTAESPREIAVAWIPLPPDVALTSASLEEVAEYVRDATMETAAEQGGKYRPGSLRTGTIGGHDYARFDLTGTDAKGIEHRVALIVVRQVNAAVVVSFGCPSAAADEILPLLERCAETLRLQSTAR